MPAPPGRLRHIADALDAEARELDRARQQETKPKHLWVHARRAAIRATRLLLAAIDEGADLLGPFRLVDGDRPLVELDRRSDEALLRYWQHFGVTWLRSKCPDEFAADAGAFDFPAFKTDAKGQLLTKDGKPAGWKAADIRAMERARQTGASFKEKLRVFRDGLRNASEPASVVDDYDEADALSHLRAQARDWADACRAAARLLRDQALLPRAKEGGPSDRQRLILETMLSLGATAPEARLTHKVVVQNMNPGDDPDNYKHDFQALRRYDLTDSIRGAGGGVWLTPTGTREASRDSEPPAD